MSELFWHYKRYDFMYVIDMNTHFLLFFNYYIVVTFAQFWITSSFNKLIDCWFIWHSAIVFPSDKHSISKGKLDILEILILLFYFSYFDVKNFKDDFTYTKFTAFIFMINFLDYESLIISRVKIKKTLIYYFNADFTVYKGWRGCFEHPDFFIRVVECYERGFILI